MRVNFSNIFVSVLLVSISVASGAIACVNCLIHVFFITLHTHPFSVFLTHILQHTAQKFFFINLGHSLLNISKNNHDISYRFMDSSPTDYEFFPYTIFFHSISQKDQPRRFRSGVTQLPLNFSIYKLYNPEISLSHSVSCSN